MEQSLGSLMPGSGTAEVVTTPGKSAASWGAIVAGAFVAASSSLILITLGSGIGFASISAWPDHGVSAKTFTITTAIWLIVTQWLSAALGGYIAGRLRTRWVGTHTHEAFFRDTAHGLVTWSVATLLTAAVVAGSVVSMTAHGLHAASEGAGALAAHEDGGDQRGFDGERSFNGHADLYGIDAMFRPADSSNAQAMTVTGAAEAKAEAGRIIVHDLASGGVTEADRAYLASLVGARTGLSPADAQRRVQDFLTATADEETKARAAAEAARQAAAEAALYAALSMLMGAFIASVSAALGGRLRDQHP